MCVCLCVCGGGGGRNYIVSRLEGMDPYRNVHGRRDRKSDEKREKNNIKKRGKLRHD